jgi:bifunctional oligoribonuclease and PAP phosphatase NrnA
MIQQVIQDIKNAHSILLTTHRQCDGDGLGSELAIYHALKKIGKNVRILNVDGTPQKYDFLKPEKYIQCFDSPHGPIENSDLALIFDTNDRRLIEPLYEALEEKCKKIVFVDHHPILSEGPAPTQGSIIDIRAASTGELAYDIIQGLQIPLDPTIARALYTSIAFDTQLFRYIRNSSKSHQIAIELLKYENQPAEVHRKLFGNFTAPKLKFIAQSLSRVEFFSNEQIAILLIKTSELEDMGLNIDDSRDLIDMIMNIESVEAAALFREDAKNVFKMSLRSKGRFPILNIAENFGGGGHHFASGASIKGNYEDLKNKTLESMQKILSENQ